MVTDDGRTHTIYGIGVRPFRSSKAVREFIDASNLRAAGPRVPSQTAGTGVRWSWIWKRFAAIIGVIVLMFALIVLISWIVNVI